MNFASTEIDDSLTDNLKKSFVNDYPFWKNIINNTNDAIQVNIRNITEVDDDFLLYTYDEFCNKFITSIEKMEKGSIFNQNIIQDVLMKMIHEKYR